MLDASDTTKNNLTKSAVDGNRTRHGLLDRQISTPVGLYSVMYVCIIHRKKEKARKIHRASVDFLFSTTGEVCLVTPTQLALLRPLGRRWLIRPRLMLFHNIKRSSFHWSRLARDCPWLYETLAALPKPRRYLLA